MARNLTRDLHKYGKVVRLIGGSEEGAVFAATLDNSRVRMGYVGGPMRDFPPSHKAHPLIVMAVLSHAGEEVLENLIQQFKV